MAKIVSTTNEYSFILRKGIGRGTNPGFILLNIQSRPVIRKCIAKILENTLTNILH